MLFLRRHAPVCGCPIQCREYCCPSHTIENISGIRHRIGISLRHIVEIPVIYGKSMGPVLFLHQDHSTRPRGRRGTYDPILEHFIYLLGYLRLNFRRNTQRPASDRPLIQKSDNVFRGSNFARALRVLRENVFHLDSTLRMAVSSRGDSFGFLSNLSWPPSYLPPLPSQSA